MQNLEDIGFYTLTNKRAQNTNMYSPLWRCELLLTDKCNFKCPYCRGMRQDLKGTLSLQKALNIIDLWGDGKLQNIRFSGGEPTLYKHLINVIKKSKQRGIKRIAISTNGSADFEFYKKLIDYGVNDFSISLDACCSAFGEIMNGGISRLWEKTIDNIKKLSKLTYVTVGMVFTERNIEDSFNSILYASSLGVADIRIISSAQFNKALEGLENLPSNILDKHPILKYRVTNFKNNLNVRGIKENDTKKCYLVLDDMAIAKNYHFPCIIYLREMGNPIGKVSNKMRQERFEWFLHHNTHEDIICKKNCLDVCIDYNNKVATF